MDNALGVIAATYAEAVNDALDGKFVLMEQRFDHLDRDVQRVIERIFPVN